tara:strand:+ start:37 stop:279 length:243 start_codon:yes stop_codon:yes gene_type:complete
MVPFFKSRKLLCAIALFVVATVFVFIGQTDFQGWSDFVKWVFGIYAAGNVGEHTANKINTGSGTSHSTSPFQVRNKDTTE